MKRVNFLPNMITAFGLSCGLFVIFRCVMVGAPTFEFLRQMTIILLIAGVADLLDGALARAIHAESEFGVLFDSLSDSVTFGVAPSILFLKVLPQTFTVGIFSLFAIAASMLYTICGVLRLVRYSVKDRKKEIEEASKKAFVGLPIPSAAAAAISPNLLLHSPIFRSWIEIPQEAEILIIGIAMIIAANLMVSRLRFPSLKNAHFKMPSFHLIFFTIVMAILIIYGFLYYFSFLLIGISWSYVLLGVILSVGRMIAGRKSKHLKDFEPLDEDDDR